MLGDFFKGIGLGAGLMYLFDPDRGRRRRAMLRDQAFSSLRRTEHTLEAAGRDVSNRLTGLSHEVTSLFQDDEAPDPVVAERVRARMGRYVSHPGAIQVTCHNGRITLSGPVLDHEVGDFLNAVCSVRGVREVENRLDVHKQPLNISALQGGRPRPGEEMELFQSNWSPATRVAAGLAGGLLMVNCLARRSAGALLMGTLGFGLFMRATTNQETGRWTGLGEGRRGIDFQKTVHIQAPVEKVFDFFSDFERFSRFLINVEEARDMGDGRVHWTLCGPAGSKIHLEEETTQVVPNEMICWRSTSNSPVPYAGIARFEKAGDGTRVDIKMTYSPPGGVLGHAVASLFGIDPKSQMDEDLLRVKTWLETGKAPHDVPAAREDGRGRHEQKGEPQPAAATRITGEPVRPMEPEEGVAVGPRGETTTTSGGPIP